MWAISASRPFGDHVQPMLFVSGVVAVVIGVVAAAPLAIRIVAAPAARFPFAARLALRDLGRFQSRAAAAVAAITLTLGLSVAVVGLAQANEYRSDEGNLSAQQVLIRLGDGKAIRTPDPAAGPKTGPSAGASNEGDEKAAAVAGALPGSTLLPLSVAMNPTPAQPGEHEPVGEVVQEGPHSERLVDIPVVATPEVLAFYGIDPATIDESTDLLTISKQDVQLSDIGSKARGPMATVVQRVDLPAYTSGPTALITEAAMQRQGWVASRSGWLVQSPHALTTEEIAAARSAAAPLGLTVETRTGQDALATVRTVATTAGIVLALATLLMTIGLIRSEGAGDLRTLTATGAGPRTRRALTATTAGALTVVGVVLGTSGAYLALVAAYHTDLDRLVPLPLIDLLLIAVGLPLAASAIGWVLAGSEPRTFSRQALE
jgi:putative ABC transport system permease protein